MATSNFPLNCSKYANVCGEPGVGQCFARIAENKKGSHDYHDCLLMNLDKTQDDIKLGQMTGILQ